MSTGTVMDEHTVRFDDYVLKFMSAKSPRFEFDSHRATIRAVALLFW